jgi:tetratricopeptide (TPR) repeat protein
MERLKDTPAAIGHARRAVETNPHYAKALAHLAELEHRTGASADALEHLRRAIRAGADWADVHCRLGDLLRECGQADEAASHYRHALQLNQRYQRAAEGLSGLAA